MKYKKSPGKLHAEGFFCAGRERLYSFRLDFFTAIVDKLVRYHIYSTEYDRSG